MTRHTQRPTPPATPIQTALRALPSVEEVRLALEARLRDAGDAAPHAALVRAARAALATVRDRIRAGEESPNHARIVAEAARTLSLQRRPHLRPVINATGVIINTNLGRAPLSERAIAQMIAVARGYSNLEFDLAANERGSRQTHTRDLLCTLTGAEDALVVNNNAAATLVALAVLAAGREVVIARGELVEIGGGFRVPDVMAQSGARLVEVGTTNRVRVDDYAAAITPETALLLVVHPSNFRIIGFT
ncbi:MAG TPA: L-seryl-tRNA(Sec) selenium transferase, partial [Ktedonobacterales bacterium]